MMHLVGLSGHGKTAYTAALFYCLEHQLPKVWPKFYRQALDLESLNVVRESLALFGGGHLPAATRPELPRPSIHMLSNIPGFGSHPLVIYDPPGEMLSSAEPEGYLYPAKTSTAVTFLIDIGGFSEPAAAGMEQLLESYILQLARMKIRTNRRHLIVTYTKADLLLARLQAYPDIVNYLIEDEPHLSSDIHRYIRRMRDISSALVDFTAAEIGAHAFLRTAYDSFRSVFFCANSALGSAPEAGYLATKPHPLRVIDPLLRAFDISSLWDQRLASAARSLFTPVLQANSRPSATSTYFQIMENLNSTLAATTQIGSDDSASRTDWHKAADQLAKFLESTLEFLRVDGPSVDSCTCRYTWDCGSLFQDLNLPKQVVLIIFPAHAFGAPAVDDLQTLVHQNGLYGQVLILIFAGNNEHILSDAMELARSKLHQTYAYNLVVLQQKELLSCVASTDPTSRFRRLVVSNLDLTAVSPFTVTGPATEGIFFGREREIKEVADHIARSNYAILGGRRIGKTSVLMRLHRLHLPARGSRTIYHDASTTPSHRDFMGSAVRDWHPDPPRRPPSTFGELFRAPPTDRPLVLLLDEADKLIPSDRSENWVLFNTLRFLTTSHEIHVILSGEHELELAMQDSTSPLFNFANLILLGPLDFHDVSELITQPMEKLGIGLVDAPAIVDCIYRFTSGHPNIVQRLCRRIIVRLNQQDRRYITLDDITEIIKDTSFQRDDFLSTYWEAATSLEKIISLLMTNDKSVRTLNTVRQALSWQCNVQPKVREVDEALQRLVGLRSILRHTLTGYEFAAEAFPSVVAGTITLDDMLEILTEEYREQSE